MLRPILFCSVLITLFFSSSAQSSCQKYAFTSNKVFSACSDLPQLNSFLHWTYNPSSGTARIAYRQTGITSSRWVAWAINPTSTGMVGSQALVALLKSDGTMNVYTSSVDSYQTQLQKGELSFDVSDLSATHSNNEIVIFATVTLPNNSTTVNQVWQNGPVSNDAPGIHATSGSNVQSMATLNLLSGASAASGASGAVSSRLRKMNIHGVLNVVSWGIMMPLGVIIARYVKVFESADPAWFYLHVTCQTSAYIIGVAGWATGMQLGNESPGVQQTVHRTIGILLFSLATLQVFALFLRPKKDNKYRLYWNIYHHSIGYTIIILSIINIFKGLDILKPANKWEQSYIGIIVSLGIAAVLLEVYTWTVVLKRKKAEKAPVGTNGFYGYGARTQNVV
ncbi:cytochrome b561 and DOMON domain-containing protein At4g17280-like [Rhododendron vialii]|uniref:cytochrome b561 and DOMON domain-containing protein At4g17280-like n=1 Tax=Rhododendron vialii TaxID=182163 RepID=UPI00265ED139|nr:cytochrome b561 and DOMON domain-containing protein At4g17280-like [Rhododendron vialii]